MHPLATVNPTAARRRCQLSLPLTLTLVTVAVHCPLPLTLPLPLAPVAATGVKSAEPPPWQHLHPRHRWPRLG